MQLWTIIAKTIAKIWATAKSQSCSSAHPPWKKAVPRLLAIFTDVLVTGMLTKCMAVNVRPTVMPVKWDGKLLCVVDKMTNNKTAVITVSVRRQETML